MQVSWHFCLTSSLVGCIAPELGGGDPWILTSFFRPLFPPGLYPVMLYQVPKRLNRKTYEPKDAWKIGWTAELKVLWSPLQSPSCSLWSALLIIIRIVWGTVLSTSLQMIWSYGWYTGRVRDLVWPDQVEEMT